MTLLKRKVSLPLACGALLAGAASLPAQAVAILLSPATPVDAVYYFRTPTKTTFPLTTADVLTVVGPGAYTSGSSTATLALLPSATVRLNLSGPGFTGTGIRYFYEISGGSLGAGGTVAGTLTTSKSVSGMGVHKSLYETSHA